MTGQIEQNHTGHSILGSRSVKIIGMRVMNSEEILLNKADILHQRQL